MTDENRFRLFFGPYAAPPFSYGDVVMCEFRGEVTLVGLTAARIPWPIAKRSRSKSLAIYAGLAHALRRESNQAICYWWGITPQTVTKWRKALGVGEVTEGTSELKRQHFAEEWGQEAKKKSWAKAKDPERRRKIADAKRGKPRPRHVIDAMTRGRLAKGFSEETRRKMSESHKRRGTLPPAARKRMEARQLRELQERE